MFRKVRRQTGKLLICGLVLAAIPQTMSAAQAEEGVAEKGKELARLQCARCHVLPGLRNMGIGSTPSFKIMVQSKAEDWRDKFEAFYSLPPHPAFVTIKELRTERSGPSIIAPIIIGLRDLDDLMAFVDELAKEHRSK